MNPMESSLLAAGQRLGEAHTRDILARAMRKDAAPAEHRERYRRALHRLCGKGCFDITARDPMPKGFRLRFVRQPERKPSRDRSGLAWLTGIDLQRAWGSRHVSH